MGGSKSKRYMGSRKEVVGWERVESCSRLLYRKNWPMMDVCRPGNIRKKPSLQTGQRELVSMAPLAELCMLGRPWVAVMTGVRQSARLKGKRRGVVRRGRKTK